MSESKRYYINPIPDEGGALDKLPNVICLDETPGINYYTYVRERTCHIEMVLGYDGDLPAYYREYKCSECKEEFSYYKHDRVSYCPNCGAKVAE